MSSRKDKIEENNVSPRGHSRSRSKSPSRSRSRSYSRSRTPVKRRRSYSRSYSRSRSRSHGRYHRSPSRSPPYRRRSPKRRYRRHSRSTSHSPYSSRRRHQGNRFNPECSNVLGVFGLSIYTNEKDIQEIFEKYGKIESVQIVYDHNTSRSRGFCFIYFEDTNDAVEAKENCNGIEVDGRKIRVDYSITKRPHTPTPGIYMGKPTSRNRDRDRRDRDRYDDYDRDRDYYSRDGRR